MQVNILYDPLDPGQIILENLLNSEVANPFRLTVPNPAASPPIATLTYNGFVQIVPLSMSLWMQRYLGRSPSVSLATTRKDSP